MTTTITLFNTGDYLADLTEWFRVEAADYPHVSALQEPQPLAVLALAVQTPEGVVLVDAPLYDEVEMTPVPGTTPPPPLVEQLAQAGISADAVAHVIITHAHFDHFNGLTEEVGGEWLPVYPNAVHYLGEGDWNVMQHKLWQAGSLEARTFGVLHRLGKLALVKEEREVAPGVTILPAPGESPGHQIVRVEVGDSILYHTGDLIHHPIEIEHPQWACWWAERPQHDETRNQLIGRALSENATLVASHVPGMGRIEQTAQGLRWVGDDGRQTTDDRRHKNIRRLTSDN
jgi:glyoxylase-like metal-dependent hydrolase (beta-lactamase superfamily II)